MAKSNTIKDDFNADKKLAEYDADLAEVNEKIKGYKNQIATLTEERHRILARIKDIDMDIVLQCIIDRGLSSQEVLTLINNYKHSQ